MQHTDHHVLSACAQVRHWRTPGAHPPKPVPLSEAGRGLCDPYPPCPFSQQFQVPTLSVTKIDTYDDAVWYVYMRATHVTSEEKAEILKWDQILRKEGLGMSRGRMGGKLTYVTPHKLQQIENRIDVPEIAELEGD